MKTIQKTIQKIVQIKTVYFAGSLFLLCLHGNAYALMCPNNFNEIVEGDSTAQAEKQCGKPVKINKSEKEAGSPQEWTYYMQQPKSLAYGDQPNIKTTMAFDQDGKLINISVDGYGMKNTKLCNNKPIQLHDTIEKVKDACGSPTMVNKQDTDVQTGQARPKIKIEEWVYGDAFNTVLIFKDGKYAGVKEE